MPDRIFAVEVSGVPDEISDLDIKAALATSISRLLRDKKITTGFSVGTSGGMVKTSAGTTTSRASFADELFKRNLIAVPDFDSEEE